MRSLSLAACGVVLGSLVMIAGCNRGQQEFVDYDQSEQAEPHDHHHHHDHGHGPHGGHVFDLGDHEYLAELVFDEETHAITVYILDHDTGEVLPIDQEEVTLTLMIDEQPTPFTLTAAPLEGDPEGKASRFELVGDEVIAEHIHDEEELEGELHVTIDDTPLTGTITHDHDHHHDHGDHGHGDHGHGDHDHGDHDHGDHDHGDHDHGKEHSH